MEENKNTTQEQMNFDTAQNEAQNIFNEGEQNPAQAEVPTQAEAPAQAEASVQDRAEQALSAAEAAVETIKQKDAQLQQIISQMQQLQEQNDSLQETLKEMSQQQAESVTEQAMQMPTLDVNALAFASEDEIRNAQSAYAQKMAEFVKSDVLREISPFVEQAREGQRIKERDETISTLAQVPELAGIDAMVPQLERIIENNRALSSADLPTDEKYIMAYAMARGVNSINNPQREPKDPTAEELMRYYENNADFRDLIEQKRVNDVKNSQQVPPFSASNGAVNVALNIPDKPETFDDARSAARKILGLGN